MDPLEETHVARVAADAIDATLQVFEDEEVDAEEFEAAGEEVELEIDIDEVASGSSECIDDPVRMYLMQMGEIPLLTRAEELSTRQAIEKTRTRFRHSMLASDFVLQGAVPAAGEGPRRRSCASTARSKSRSPTRSRRSESCADWARIWKRWSSCCSRTSATIASRSTRSTPSSERHEAWRRLIRRRNRAVRLVEELNLRTQRLQPLLDKLAEIAQRMQALRGQMAELDKHSCTAGRVELRCELHYLMRITAESPATLHRRVQRTAGTANPIRRRQTRALGRQPAARRLDRQALSQSRPELPGSDPGRQHGPDAGGRQVRVRSRLQVLDLRHLVDSPGDHAGHRRSEPHDPRAGAHDRHHDPGAHRDARAGAAERLRAERRADGGGRRPVAGRHALHHEDVSPAAVARPAGRRSRRQLLRRVPARPSRRRSALRLQPAIAQEPAGRRDAEPQPPRA